MSCKHNGEGGNNNEQDDWNQKNPTTMTIPLNRKLPGALVPDLAMVPKLLINSFFVMPIPESSMVSVELVLSGMILS